MQTNIVVKERPILFSGAMVAAILAGTKSQTRRVIKPQPPEHCNTPLFDSLGRGWFYDGLDEDGNSNDFWPNNDMGLLCPYGQVGDRLWVRETWCNAARYGYDAPDDGRPGIGDDYSVPYPVWYKATDNVDTEAHGWRPSIFMPRWASRLTLEITEVRARRLNDISIEDVLAEGIEKDMTDSQYWRENTGNRFTSLWNSINGKRGYTWESNPWVFAISFRRIE